MNRLGYLLVLPCLALLAFSAQAAAIPNGSFEDTSLGTGWVTEVADWTMDPTIPRRSTNRVGVFGSFGDPSDLVLPTHGDYFLVMTHKLGGDQATISSTFTLDVVAQEKLSFDYLYVTATPPGDATHVDPFTVTISDTTGVLESYTVSDTNDSDLALGTINQQPFNVVPTYDTGWQTFSVNVTSLLNSTVFVTFEVEDSAQGGFAGVFLDNVNLIPEPGTLFLLGAGFLGLGVYGRRKLKRKKA